MSRREWKDEEINLLKELFPNTPAKIIGKILSRSTASVNTYANKFGIKKPVGYQRRNHAEILLDGSLQSMYWIGFLLADGHFHKRGSTLRLDLAEFDREIIEQFKAYVKSQSNICTSNYSGTRNPTLHLTLVHSDAIPELCTQFGITSQKTYNPPNFDSYILSDNQWIALIIGFIDGDGYIQISKSSANTLYTRIKINMEIHKSWEHNLNLIKYKLYKRVGLEYKCAKARLINGSNTIQTSIASTKVILSLGKFIQDNKLKVMSRKWDKLNQITQFNRHYNN